MNLAELKKSLRSKVSGEIDVDAEGVNRFVIYTPFMFDDGDHFVVLLKQQDNRWFFTDEGHTIMHMSYGEIDLTQGTRKSIIDQALLNFQLTNDRGELRLEVSTEEFGDALFSFIQGLMKVSDASYWTRERVRSTFYEDFRTVLEATIPAHRREFDYTDPIHDPDGIYPVDCKVNGMPQPLFIFAINGDAKCRDATITVLQFEKWRNTIRSMGIFEDQTQINSKVLARFSDVAGKLFSSLGARDRIEAYLGEILT